MNFHGLIQSGANLTIDADTITIDLRPSKSPCVVMLDAWTLTIDKRLVVHGNSAPDTLARFCLNGGRWHRGIEAIDCSFAHWAFHEVRNPEGPGLLLITRDSQSENVVIGGSHVPRFIDCKWSAIETRVDGPGGKGERSFARLRVGPIFVHGSPAASFAGRVYDSTIGPIGGNISNRDAEYMVDFLEPSPNTVVRDIGVEGDGDGDKQFCIIRRTRNTGGPPKIDNCSWRNRVKAGNYVRDAWQVYEVTR